MTTLQIPVNTPQQVQPTPSKAVRPSSPFGRSSIAPCNLQQRQNEGVGGVQHRLATSVCQLSHDQEEQGPTEPHTGRSTFLLSSGGAGGGYY